MTIRLSYSHAHSRTHACSSAHDSWTIIHWEQFKRYKCWRINNLSLCWLKYQFKLFNYYYCVYLFLFVRWTKILNWRVDGWRISLLPHIYRKIFAFAEPLHSETYQRNTHDCWNNTFIGTIVGHSKHMFPRRNLCKCNADRLLHSKFRVKPHSPTPAISI